jgi:hypothetical protein
MVHLYVPASGTFASPMSRISEGSASSVVLPRRTYTMSFFSLPYGLPRQERRLLRIVMTPTVLPRRGAPQRNVSFGFTLPLLNCCGLHRRCS